MTNQEIIIIVLLIVVTYLYYQQSKRNISLLTASIQEKEQIKDLQQEVQHYQTLYQKRIEKDLDAETLQNDKNILKTTLANQIIQNEELKKSFEEKEKQIKALTLLANKRKEDLTREKQALITLAKQKIKGKKEFQALVKKLEQSWQQDKETWTQERQSLLLDLQSKDQEKNLLITQQAQQVKELESGWQKEQQQWQNNLHLLTQLQSFHHLVEKSSGPSLNREQVNQAESLVEQITQPQIKQLASWMVTDSAFILGHNNLLNKLAEQESKMEGLRERINLLTTENRELTEEMKEKSKVYQEQLTLLANNSEHQEQLRKINELFDPAAKDYEKIDFNGLYSLLSQIKDQLNKPTSEISTQTEPDGTEEVLDELLTNIRKLNSEL